MTAKVGVVAVLLSVVTAIPAAAQGCTLVPGRVVLLAGGFTGLEIAAVVTQRDRWWPDPTGRFTVSWDASANKGQDRWLHGLAGYHVSQLSAMALDWACVPRTAASWVGAAVGIAFLLPKEIGDGLQEGRSFSLPDMAATTAGAVLPALHRTVPATRLLRYKFNYWPSREYRTLPSNQVSMASDYAGQRYYVVVSPGRLSGGAGAWPDWLGVAIGHSVPQWLTDPPIHQWYVTLDVNATGLPIRATWWRAVATALDQLHIPLPGIRIQSGAVTFGMF